MATGGKKKSRVEGTRMRRERKESREAVTML